MTDGFQHPEDENQLIELIKEAASKKEQLRVRGSAHSVPAAIFTDGYDGEGPPPSGIDVMIDKLAAVTIEPNGTGGATVKAGAGCHLGKDPYDPTGTSTWKNSLNYQLQRQGFALADMGGISHQTVGGFLMTGSAGGTVQYSLGASIQSIRFVDGTGTVHEVCRGDDLFHAVGVSMGLLGVITEVTFDAIPNYAIVGDQTTVGTADPLSPVKLFADADDPRSLQRFLEETPYTRLMWWPQHDFHRVQIWRASRMGWIPGGTRKPYEELGRAPRLAALAGSLVYTIIGNLKNIKAIPDELTYWYQHLTDTLSGEPNPDACLTIPPDQTGPFKLEDVTGWLINGLASGAKAEHAGLKPLGDLHDELRSEIDKLLKELGHDVLAGVEGLWRLIVKVFVAFVAAIAKKLVNEPWVQKIANVLDAHLPTLMPPVLGLFVSDGAQVFYDSWRCGLPMDNQMNDQLWPTDFTELWVPLDKTTEVMNTLREYYAGDGTPEGAYAATGAFSCELYAAGSSDFWLSPAYDKDVFRVDVFWFGRNAGTPEDFYAPFWERLKPYNFRPHWGKWLPPASPAWQQYYRAQYPKLESFLELRAKLDPNGIFANDYWSQHLGF
ncbi:MAG: D-arabinono-1,4-lactone oxidase [Myxococcota bacterium]